MRMYNPPHPAMTIKEDILPELGLTVTAAAKQLGVSRAALSRLLNGKAAISADMAIRLSEALGTTPELWLGMQSAYDLWQAGQRPRPHVERMFFASQAA